MSTVSISTFSHVFLCIDLLSRMVDWLTLEFFVLPVALESDAESARESTVVPRNFSEQRSAPTDEAGSDGGYDAEA